MTLSAHVALRPTSVDVVGHLFRWLSVSSTMKSGPLLIIGDYYGSTLVDEAFICGYQTPVLWTCRIGNEKALLGGSPILCLRFAHA